VIREASRKYLDEAAMAARLGVSRRTLQRWRAEGGGPPYVRLGPRRVAYEEAAADAWAAGRSFASRAAELAAA
jgi:predicted DNA-binding transcriptional regulator AlpA